MQNRSPNVIIALFFLAISIVGGYLYYMRDAPQEQESKTIQFNQQLNNALAKRASVDYTGSINDLTTLLADAPDKNAEGRAWIFLAANLFSRNQGDDRSQSIKMYKKVVNDYGVSPYLRSRALASIANSVRKIDIAFYTLYFSDPPFNAFLPSSGSDSFKLSRAYLKILELSDEVHPNANSKYAIAGGYYAPELANQRDLGGTTPEEGARIMQKYVKEGDVIQDDTLSVPNVILQGYHDRASALFASNRILKNLKRDDIETAYKLILEKSLRHTKLGDYLALAVEMKARFSYASFLFESFGKERYPDIVEILNPYGVAISDANPVYKPTRDIWVGRRSRPDSDIVKTRAIALAKISPEFHVFLESIGFKL